MFPRLRARYLMLPPFILSLSKGACRRTILPASEVHVLIRMKWYKSRSWEKPAQGDNPRENPKANSNSSMCSPIQSHTTLANTVNQNSIFHYRAVSPISSGPVTYPHIPLYPHRPTVLKYPPTNQSQTTRNINPNLYMSLAGPKKIFLRS